jgi:5-methyltetrahydropteroyltriglutamate--homocysteine methyltransferase
MRPSGKPPFRADHIGSLLRPASLRAAFKDRTSGRLDEAGFRKAQDEAIRDVVKLQRNVGLPVITDGEFRRSSYWGRFVERIDGFVIKPAVFKFRDDSGKEADFTAPYAEGRLKRMQPLAVDEFDFLKKLAGESAKVTLPTPSTMHFYRPVDFASRDVYSSADAFLADLTGIYRQELADLAAAGCKYVQLDEVSIAMLCDPKIRETIEGLGQSANDLIDVYISAINQALTDLPADLIVGLHVCRGNFRGRYLADGGYDWVAERLFQNANVNHFLLEYDTGRAGDFAPLRFVPKSKGVVLGIISSKSPQMERLDDLHRRVDEAARFMDANRLAVSPQCGFASTVHGNPMTIDDEQAKLRLVVDLAERTWKSTTVN